MKRGEENIPVDIRISKGRECHNKSSIFDYDFNLTGMLSAETPSFFSVNVTGNANFNINN